MRRKVLALAAVASLLVWRRRAGRRKREPITTSERPGWRYEISRLKGIIAPPVEILPPGVRFERDVKVAARGGTILRVNVFRPERGGRDPVIMCAHPYGKDNLPERGHFGYRPAPQYRMLRQPEPLSFSAWTNREAPDPAYWVRHNGSTAAIPLTARRAEALTT